MRTKTREVVLRRRWTFAFAGLVAVGMLTVLAAGCGGDGGNKEAGGATTGISSACDLAYVSKQIDDHKRIADWKYPGDPFDAKKAAGKTIFSIQENSTNPFTNTVLAGMSDVAGKIGMKLVDYPNQG